MVDTENVHTFTGRLTTQKGGGSGTIGASTVPASVARRYLYRQKLANEGGNPKVVYIKQKRHANAFTDRTVVPANNTINYGNNPNVHRVLPFDSGGTIEVALEDLTGTISVTMNFVDL